MNLAANLVATAGIHPQRPALLAGDTEISYRQFQDRALATAGWLREKGIKPGDRVGIMFPNSPAFALLYYGALSAGATVVPMNPLLAAPEISYLLTDSGASILLTAQACVANATEGAAEAKVPAVEVGSAGLTEAELHDSTSFAAPVDRAGADTAVILYTSGTTGQPKGAELTHDNLTSNALATKETLMQATENDVVMGCLPLFHVFGLTCGLNATVMAGACLALLPRFDPVAALELIQHRKVTVFQGVPTMYSDMMHAPDAGTYDVSTLRACMSGGSALPVEVLHSFEKAFDTFILEGYGLSEASPVVSFNHPGSERKVGSVGQPITGVSVRILDDEGAELAVDEAGEIAVRGDCVMKGYWGKPEETQQAIPDGWFRTGDIGKMDADGYLYIVDRKKQLIIRGGFNVYPREIEEVLHQHPAVAEVAVIGLPHERLGEEVAAAVVLKPDASAEPEELRAFCKERVAAYKYPRHVWITESLPKGPTNKILHREVVAPDWVDVR